MELPTSVHSKHFKMITSTRALKMSLFSHKSIQQVSLVNMTWQATLLTIRGVAWFLQCRYIANMELGFLPFYDKLLIIPG